MPHRHPLDPHLDAAQDTLHACVTAIVHDPAGAPHDIADLIANLTPLETTAVALMSIELAARLHQHWAASTDTSDTDRDNLWQTLLLETAHQRAA